MYGVWDLPKALDSSKVVHEDLPPREGALGERRDSMYCTPLGMTGASYAECSLQTGMARGLTCAICRVQGPCCSACGFKAERESGRACSAATVASEEIKGPGKIVS